MKKVFQSSIEVMHIFAQQEQTEGRTSSKNVFFENEKIYSYGYHYLLAEFINDTTIIINNTGYSRTTGKHISQITQATRQHKQYFFNDICLQNVYNRITEASQKLINARKKDIYSLEIINAFESFTSFVKEFNKFVNNSCYGYNLVNSESLKNNDTYKEIQKIYLQIFENKEQFIKEGKERIKKEKEREKEKFKKDLEKFFNYELNYIHKKTDTEDYLRISEDKTLIETTQGVKIDMHEAKQLYKLIESKQDIKGHKIGYYTAISLNGSLTIGCHKINVKNVHEIGQKIKNL